MDQTDELRREIGHRRYLLRRTVKLSQVELAEKSGISDRTIRDAEDGKPVSEAALIAIAGALGVPVGAYVDPAPLAAPTGAESR